MTTSTQTWPRSPRGSDHAQTHTNTHAQTQMWLRMESRERTWLKEAQKRVKLVLSVDTQPLNPGCCHLSCILISSLRCVNCYLKAIYMWRYCECSLTHEDSLWSFLSQPFESPDQREGELWFRTELSRFPLISNSLSQTSECIEESACACELRIFSLGWDRGCAG